MFQVILVFQVMTLYGIQWLRKAQCSKERLWAKFILHDFLRLGGLGCLNAIRTTKDNERDGLYKYNQYLARCWWHLKLEEEIDESTFLSQTVWNNRRFSRRTKGKVNMIQGNLLMQKGYTRVGDFFDQDGRIIEGEGPSLVTFPLQFRMEWSLAVRFIKTHRSIHNIEITKGYSNSIAMPQSKDKLDHEIFLSDGDSVIELNDLTQRITLKIVARRRNDKTPYMERIKNSLQIEVQEVEKHYKNITQIEASSSKCMLDFCMETINCISLDIQTVKNVKDAVVRCKTYNTCSLSAQ